MDHAEIRKSRCLNGAEGIIGRIKPFSAEEIILASYVHTENERAKELLQRYEKMVILAKVNPERYKQERDELHLDMAEYIHEQQIYREWVDFIYFLNVQLAENRIQDAYKSEVMETWNYLTNYGNVNIYGLTSDNQLMVCDEVYGDWDLPLHKIQKLYRNKKISMEQMLQMYAHEDRKSGLFMIERHENLIDISIFESIPFINERTENIMPIKWMEMAYLANLKLPRQWKSTEFYKEQLKKRKFKIDRKGCKAFFKNAGNIKEIFFMEDVTKEKQIVMLYRVTTTKGSFMGFYHLGDDYFFSAYRSSDNKEVHYDLENFVLEVYTEIVCGLEKDRKRIYALQEVEDIDNIENMKPTHVYVEFSLYDKKYDSDELNGKRRKGTKQKAHDRGIAIRKLREGQHASEEAYERAMEYGIELQEGYTFVRSYSVGGIKDVRQEMK